MTDDLVVKAALKDELSGPIGEIRSEAKELRGELEKTADSGDDAGRSLTRLTRRATEAGKSLGGGLTRGFKSAAKGAKDLGKKAGPGLLSGLKLGAAGGAVAGLALGAAVLGGVTKALDQGQVKAVLAAQIGAAGADAERLGKVAGQLYVAGYGESLGETAELIRAAYQDGLISLRGSDAQIKDVVASVSTFTTLTGEDAVSATRAVSQAIKTGLVEDAKEGFDLITRSQQLGINKSEDLLDTLNEYGTQFRKLGLNGTEALGLVRQMIQGGARDSDVAADAIKEFSIRAVDGSATTKDGFKSLGLSVDKTVKAFGKGGPAAKKTFDQVLDGLRKVKDPVERNRIGVELFGTQWEDLGAAIGKADLSTAVKGMGAVTGAVDRANASLSNTPAAKIQTTWRTLQQVFVDAIGKYIVPYLDQFASWFNGRGKFAVVDWALAAAKAILSFADQSMGVLQTVLGFVSSWGKALLYSMAATVAPFNLDLARSLKHAGDESANWANRTKASLATARAGIHKTQSAIDKARLMVKLTADKEDLDTKIAAARLELKDPNLTKERKAKLTADIVELTKKRMAAQAELDKLKDKTVKITAEFSARQTRAVNDRLNQFGRGGIGGDTPTRRGHGGGLGATLAAHSRINASLGGGYHVSNLLVGGGGHGRGSGDHQAGRAVDVTGRGLGAYAAAVRREGGYAAVHGQGAERHVHAVPAGDTNTSRARRSKNARGATGGAGVQVLVQPGAIVVYAHGQVDVEEAVENALNNIIRDAEERA